jgi:hypothetical protein
MLGMLALPFAGCSIHPIPFDVPGYRTIDIVKKIRCETKRALDKFSQKEEFKRRLYDRMSIGYRFTFTITENNKAGAGAGLEFPVTNGNFILGAAASADRQRVGERVFTIVDTFRDARDPKVCSIEATGENHAYPITGKIGLEEVVRTFLELQGLGIGRLPPVAFEVPELRRGFRADKGPKKKEGAADAKTEEFVETFEFTTTLKASVSPGVELKAVGSRISVLDASGSLAADRTDKHQVVITLAPNYDAALATLYHQDVSSKLLRIQEAVRSLPR